ncbi:MAG: AraC family transcriptional regulator [Chloroflexi bacterium HGW-Chloroflexi-10]|nr:MAG: AraC family transcriptional regulator [Chloroflexi bacterium HGW-Chloroflexi-10]
MEPKFVTKPAFMVVGMRYFGKNQAGEIPRLWDAFLPHLGEIQQTDESCDSFGICNQPDAEGNFEYVAGLPVTCVDSLPEGMVARLVPQQDYAVFVHVGGLDTLGQTYEYIYQQWLPNSAYLFRPGGNDFELYHEGEFNPASKDSKMYIYVPVVTK